MASMGLRVFPYDDDDWELLRERKNYPKLVCDRTRDVEDRKKAVYTSSEEAAHECDELDDLLDFVFRKGVNNAVLIYQECLCLESKWMFLKVMQLVEAEAKREKECVESDSETSPRKAPTSVKLGPVPWIERNLHISVGDLDFYANSLRDAKASWDLAKRRESRLYMVDVQ